MAIINKILTKYRGLSTQVRASFWALLCGVLTKGITVITMPIFTRILTPSEYGQYNVFSSWMGILSIAFSLNLFADVYSQGLVKFENKKKEFSSSMQGMALVLITFWLLIYIAFKDVWNSLLNLSSVQMMAMIFMIWLSTVFEFWTAEQKNEYRYVALVIISLSFAVLNPALGFFLIKHCDDKVTARIFSFLIIEFILYFWMFFVQMRNGKKFYDKQFWNYALLYNLPLVPHYLSQVILASSDRIMIERMIGKSEAGVYSFAYSLSMVMLIINNAFMQALSPWIYRKIKAKQNKEIAPIAYATLVGVAIANMLLIAFAPEAVIIFAPKDYYEAIWVIPPVAISVFYIYSYDLFAKFTFYYEKQGFVTIASVTGALLNIILNYVCINKYGFKAAGYTTLLCYIIYAFCHYTFMNKVCDKYCNGSRPYNGKIIAFISTAFTVFGLLMLLTYNHIIIRYSIIGVIVILCLLFYKRIISFSKKIISIRKEV